MQRDIQILESLHNLRTEIFLSSRYYRPSWIYSLQESQRADMDIERRRRPGRDHDPSGQRG